MFSLIRYLRHCKTSIKRDTKNVEYDFTPIYYRGWKLVGEARDRGYEITKRIDFHGGIRQTIYCVRSPNDKLIAVFRKHWKLYEFLEDLLISE